MSGKELNRRAVESLIKSGALDSLGLKRRAMLQMLDLILESIAADGRGNIAGQYDLFGIDEGDPDEATLVPVPDVEEFDRRELMAMEKEMTGLYLSGHPMDEYRDAARHAGAVPIGPILDDFANEAGPQEYMDGQHVTLAGVVESSRTRTTKNGTLMAYIQLEDDTGTMELLAFQRALDTGGGYVAANAALLVSGRISVRDEKEPQLMVDTIRPLSDLGPGGTDEAPPKERKLWLRLPSYDAKVMRRIELLCEMFPGRERMIVVFADTGRRVGAECGIHPSLVEELGEMLGSENVVVK